MSISALPKGTVRLLGSPLVITTPVSLVKELVENSIDAKATSIDVLVSRNTIDRIEVRDNGRGIAAEDYDSLGRHGHTSKLREFEELRSIGGSSLGFRGEALASANALASVTITTRTTADPVAAVLHLVPGEGGVAKRGRASSPVGTVVSVDGLFSRLPVRKQVAIKDAPKTVVKIKELLFAYALARPHLRLSFKVFKDGKQAWTYSPRPAAGVDEAALLVFKADLASQCVLVNFPTDAGDYTAEKAAEVVIFEAFLPKPDADPAKISKGAFFSVDSRPVSATKGTMKKILSIFRSSLSNSLHLTNGSKSLRDPFIRVDISCPEAAYDPNVEPAKDDILFADEKPILDLFENLCAGVYKTESTAAKYMRSSEGERDDTLGDHCNVPTIHTHLSQENSERQSNHLHTINQLRYQSSVPEESRDVPGDAPDQRFPFQEPSSSNADLDMAADRTEGRSPPLTDDPRSNGWVVNMSARIDPSSDEDYEEAIPATTNDDADETELEEETSHSMEALNPWSIAKFNAPHKRDKARDGNRSESLTRHVSLNVESGEHNELGELPILRPLIGPPGGFNLLPNQSQEGYTNLGSSSTSVPGGPYRSPLDHSLRHHTHQTPIRRRTGDHAQLQTPPPSWKVKKKRTKAQPVNRYEEQDIEGHEDGLAQSRLSFGGGRGTESHQRQSLPNGVDDGVYTDLGFQSALVYSQTALVEPSGAAHASREQPRGRDYEQSHIRLNAVGRASKLRPLRQVSTTLTSDEGSNTTEPGQSLEAPINTGMPAEDPRSYLIRRQGSVTRTISGRKRKLRRVKSELLPLELVPEGEGVQNLTYNVETTARQLELARVEMASYDAYVTAGHLQPALDLTMGSEEIDQLKTRLDNLLSIWMKQSGEPIDMDIYLRSALKGKSVVSQA